jgi:hypothetical protein
VVVVRGCPDVSRYGCGRPGGQGWVESSPHSVEPSLCRTWKAVTFQPGDPTPLYAPRLPGNNKSREGRYMICSSDSSLSCWYHCLAGHYRVMTAPSAPNWRNFRTRSGRCKVGCTGCSPMSKVCRGDGGSPRLRRLGLANGNFSEGGVCCREWQICRWNGAPQ